MNLPCIRQDRGKTNARVHVGTGCGTLGITGVRVLFGKEQETPVHTKGSPKCVYVHTFSDSQIIAGH